VVGWNIKQTVEFQKWFDDADVVLQSDTLEHVELLKQFGPHLKRPYADTLKGSQLINLKELRFISRSKVIRGFYKTMINLSEKIYGRYLEKIIKKIENQKKVLSNEKENKKI